MRKNWFATMAAVMGFSAVPALAGAQVCAGFPTIDGQASLSAAANFPESADQFGAEVSANPMGPLAAFAGFTRTTVESETGESANTYSGGLALDVGATYMGAFPLGLSACPVASANLTDLTGADVWRVPVGVGLGGRIELGPAGTLSLMPYVVPQLVWTRVDFEENEQAGGLVGSLFGSPEDQVEDTEETNFALRTGAMVGFGRFYVGGEFVNTMNDRVEGVFGLKAGVRF